MKKGMFWPSFVEAILRQIGLLGPIFIAQVVLIGLINYRLIKAPELSDDEKKKISYTELALSFVGSFIFIFIYVVFGILGGIKVVSYGTTRDIFFGLRMIFMSLILLIFLTPFGLTTLRVALEDKLTAHQKNALSGFTIPLTVVIGMYGTLIGIGYR